MDPNVRAALDSLGRGEPSAPQMPAPASVPAGAAPPSPMAAPPAGPPAGAPRPAGGSSALSPGVRSALDALSAPSEEREPKEAATTPVRPRTTLRAPQPLPAGTPPIPASEVALGAVTNFIPSTVNAFAGLAAGVTNPGEMFRLLKETAFGLVSKGAGAIGVRQDPKAKQEAEYVIDAQIKDYASTYGDLENFKRTLRDDPARVLTDLASIASMGGGAVAKVAGAQSKVGQAGAAIARVADKIDPLSYPFKGAGYIANKSGALTRFVASHLSGVPSDLTKMASEVATGDNPAARQTFATFLKGGGDIQGTMDSVKNFLRQRQKQASADYAARVGNIGSRQIDLSQVRDAAKDYLNTLGQDAISIKQRKVARQIIRDIDRRMMSPDPADRSLLAMNDYKQRLYDIADSQSGSNARRQLMGVHARLRDSLGDPALGGDPQFAKIMSDYDRSRDEIASLSRALGASGNSPDAKRMVATAIRNLRSGTQGKSFLEEAGKYDPNISAAIAGASMSAYSAGGARTLADALLASPWFFAGLHPVGAAQLAMSSPRLGGEAIRLSGALSRAGQTATGPIPRRAAYYGAIASGVGGEPIPGEEGEAYTPEQVQGFERKINNWSRETPYDETIGASASSAGVDPVIYKRLLGSESNFDPNAISFAGPDAGTGIAQINKVHGLTREQMLDPNYAIPFAADLLAKYIGESDGDVREAIIRYKGAKSPEQREKMGQVADNILYGLETTQRPQRASGGKVTSKQAMLVNRLMQRVKTAHNQITQETKPLLDVPDEAVAHALEVANQAI